MSKQKVHFKVVTDGTSGWGEKHTSTNFYKLKAPKGYCIDQKSVNIEWNKKVGEDSSCRIVGQRFHPLLKQCTEIEVGVTACSKSGMSNYGRCGVSEGDVSVDCNKVPLFDTDE